MTKPRIKPDNPRKISVKERARLQADLERFGDLGGIVHNETTGALIGGNQRSTVFDLEHDGAAIVITETFDPPTRTGTIARGYIEWRGERYDYRRVAWDKATEDAACVIANLRGGAWDWERLATWDVSQLKEWGMDAEALATWGEATKRLGLMLDVEPPDFEPVGIDEQGRLDQKAPVTCPHCGESFIPK